MTSTSFLPAFAIVLNAVFACIVPLVSRSDIFFSVTVSRGFRDEPFAASTLLRYRAIVIAGSLAALGVATTSSPRLGVAAILAQTILVIAAWSLANRDVRPYAVSPDTVRVVSLVARRPTYPGGVISFIGPFVVLGAATLFLHTNWDLIPARVPVHWNLFGHADGWAAKSVGSVFRPLMIGAAVILATQLQTWFVLRRTRQVAASGVSADAEQLYKRRTAEYGVLSTYVMTALFSYIATRKVSDSSDTLGWGFAAIIAIVLAASFGFTAWMMLAGQAGQRRVPPNATSSATGDAAPDSAWKLGVLYFNPSDPAVFVENRMGLGWTVNFGHTLGWLVFVMAVGVPLGIVWYTRQ